MASMEYESEQRPYDGLSPSPVRRTCRHPVTYHGLLTERVDEPRGYDHRDRSRSPRRDPRDMEDSRARSASPNGRDSRGPPPESRGDDGSRNTGSNLFVTGIHPSLTEEEVTRLFEKYGVVDKCNIMKDPHTKESRGFGFILMNTAEQADAAKEGLQGEVHQGRTLSIEKARRARPRTPTPGKYYGPPKREFRGGRGGGPPRYGDRYDDRRGGGYGGGGRRDDYGYGSRGSSRYDDRPYRRDRDDYGSRGVDRYASRGDDRYGREDRRGGSGGGGGGYYDRPPPPSAGAGGYGDAPPPRQDAYGGGRPYEDRGGGDDYRQAR
ncbi:unnamed protein product [Periconia digitata]|uniref:RRM domain-containing protein n=1 Tax=Periconia digitata TaxID=1303443 RepID=A0A9W4XL55_9PLEO|nr:unnamed protein product [Periconia digitata]